MPEPRATATGPGTLTFQWQKDGVNIPNAEAFTIAKVLPQFNRADRKWVKDDAGNWFVTGQKIFITSGHGKYHFVIARTETSSDPDDVEALSGMAWLTGVPVRLDKVDPALAVPEKL